MAAAGWTVASTGPTGGWQQLWGVAQQRQGVVGRWRGVAQVVAAVGWMLAPAVPASSWQLLGGTARQRRRVVGRWRRVAQQVAHRFVAAFFVAGTTTPEIVY